MSSTSAPFGLRPAFHPSGLDRAQALANGIASGYASNILKGQPVQYGTTANSITLGTIGIAATSGAIAGAFAGVEWTDTTGRRRVSNYWPANTAVQTGSVVAYFYNDANIVYEIQADATMAQTAIGNEYPFSNITAGSAVTGLSQCTLNAGGAVGNGVQGQLRVVDIAPYPGNDWGDLFPIVRVVISQSQFFGAFTAIA
ncbi:hypothetical protein UFOVP56_25 [uncultured Caudovirales phage]|uniref:Uncharacterized protein n=1 Tax=uncultured Caudovirales phage TaxID=2100421 RepID=A0A6J5T9M7_9CAUD|nr:hypothetical protein UFOVP56_25 [uncultured Caudovirales phage]